HLRPPPRAGAVRLRVHARDVQAGREAPLGLLRAPDPPRRPPGRQARRGRRPQGLPPARERDPRERQVHARDREGGTGRAGRPRVVARAGSLYVVTFSVLRSTLAIFSPWRRSSSTSPRTCS